MDTRFRHALRAVSAAAKAFLETTDDRARLLDTIVRSVAAVVPDFCAVSVRSDDATAITIEALYDESAEVRAVFAGMLGRPPIISSSQALSNAAVDTVFMPALDIDSLVGHTGEDSLAVLRKLDARGMIVVPLRSRGELLGLLSVLRHRPDRAPLDELDRELVEHLASHAALALANAKLARERQQLAREVEASHFLDAVIDNIPDMVFVKDAATLQFVRINRAGEELLGVSGAQIIGKSDYDFFPAEEADFFITKDRETLEHKALVDIPEEPIETAHGPRWLHTKKVAITDASGTPRYLLGISEDITERKRALAALNEAKEKAEAANRELEAFSYSVAHDLRAPLRAIDGFAQALVEDYEDKLLDETGRRHLERIRAGAQRMGTLIDDLLRLSRVTRAEHRPSLISLSSLARVAVGQLERAEPERKVDIRIQDHIEVRADQKLLSIALDNLFANAWKFTRKTPDASIELGELDVDGERVFFVRDNGAGFDMQYQNKLFGVFQRLHPVAEFPGTGIGLATVKRVIERHGGRVWAESAVGKGATFSFTLGEAS